MRYILNTFAAAALIGGVGVAHAQDTQGPPLPPDAPVGELPPTDPGLDPNGALPPAGTDPLGPTDSTLPPPPLDEEDDENDGLYDDGAPFEDDATFDDGFDDGLGDPLPGEAPLN